MIKTYSELITFSSFEDRYKYLNLKGKVGIDTFGFDRVFNQEFYRSTEWHKIRDYVITRDNGCDLAVNGYTIYDKIFVHHMNPISLDDISESTEFLLNPEYLICCSFETHNAIHYGSFESAKNYECIERKPGDTKLW